MSDTKTTPTSTESTAKVFTAVIETGGHQYVVSPGMTIRIEHERGSAEKGSQLIFDKVLTVFGGDLAQAKVGAPLVAGATVTGKVIREMKTKKVIIFKKKRRHGYTKKQGHRQQMTEVIVEAINL